MVGDGSNAGEQGSATLNDADEAEAESVVTEGYRDLQKGLSVSDALALVPAIEHPSIGGSFAVEACSDEG